MAYDVSSFSDYVAREVKPLTKALFIGGDTGKFAMLQAGVKGSMKIPLITGTTTLQAGNCPNPSGDDVITEVTITVAPFTVYKSYWQGDTVGTYPLFDGFIKLIDAGAAVNGNPSGITAVTGIIPANVIDVVEGMYDVADVDVKDSEDFSILVGNDIFDMYIKAQKAANQYHYDAEHNDGIFTIGGSGAKIMRVRGLDGTNRLFAGRGADFIVGADIENEEEIAEVWYDKTDDKMYLRFKGKAGVVPANIDQIVEFTLV